MEISLRRLSRESVRPELFYMQEYIWLPKLWFCLTGDIMGTALDNIDELLQMSSGCGEQNMVHFAPNVFITRYLEETGQLTPEIKQKAIGYLESGEWITAH